MNMKNNIYYQTSDISLATTLSLFYPLHSIRSQENQKSFFVFEKTDVLNQLIKSYWSGSLKIEPKEYFNQLKNIKTRLYSER